MPVRLVDALRETLSGWHDDLPAAWRAVLEDTELDLDGCDPDLMLEHWEPIFPARKRNAFPGAPEGAHMLRAFDDIGPQDVRCVILGQDPYPEPGFATGRAFECGNVAAWRELDKMFSKSVRAFMQLICAARTGKPEYAHSFDHWPTLLADIEAGLVELEAPADIAGCWIDSGVLLLNASLTLSRFSVRTDPHQSRGHLPVWRPLMCGVLRHLARSGRPVVFMTFGDAAAECLEAAELGRIEPPVFLISRPHPADAEAILDLENPFLACNDFLEAAGERPVDW
ncbi:uracil-DNA glycosylase [Nitratireductor sp. XY-223]|uniref:uracil-DNA glycosylase n=1 Tax=Nitratireductor sp. XY-223 TaxID=2561926 RepID=UPI0010A9F332|nr:uracil-DNA glycosylase [Nitratireductor sp. XY-223]